MKSRFIVTTAIATLICSTSLSAETITTGSGEGTVQIELDGFGRFRNASFDPIGQVDRADTTFDSYVSITQGNFFVRPGADFGGGDFDEVDFGDFDEEGSDLPTNLCSV